MAKKLGIWVYSLLLAIQISCLILLFYLKNVTYELLLKTITQGIQRPDLDAVLRTTYFPEAKWQRLQYLVWPVIGLLLALILFSWVKRNTMIAWLENLFENIRARFLTAWHLFRNCHRATQGTLVILLLLTGIRSIWLSQQYPIQYDEAWNYNYFLHHQGYTSLLAYNNYPLHNLLTYFFLTLLPDNTFTLRLPVMLFGWAAMISVFLSSLKLVKQEGVAILLCLVFASLPVSLYYMLYARGVMVCLFFAIWAWYDVVQGFQGKHHPLRMALFHALAGYAMISYALLPLLVYTYTILFALVSKQRSWLRSQLKSALWFALFLTLLYLPMALGTGFSGGRTALSASSNLTALHDWFYYNYASFFTGWKYGLFLLLALNGFLFFLPSCKSQRPLLLLHGILLLMPFGFGILHWSFPPERALAFLVLPILSSLVLPVSWMPRYASIVLTCLICLLMQGYALQSDFLHWSQGLDRQAKVVAKRLADRKASRLYANDPNFSYFIPGITYYFNLKQLPLQVYSSDSHSTRYFPVDSMTHMDAFAVPGNSQLRFPVLFRNDDFVLYGKK